MISLGSVVSVSLTALTLLSSATLVDAGHLEHSKRAPIHHDARTSLAKRFSGTATYYITGLGACGHYNKPSDYIVALNSAQYGGGYPGPNCFKSLRISHGGKSAVAQVTDECPTCGYGSLDLSQALFERFEPTSAGVFPMTWEWVDGSSGGNDDNDEQEEKSRASLSIKSSKSMASVWSTQAATSRASEESVRATRSIQSRESVLSEQSLASIASVTSVAADTTSSAALTTATTDILSSSITVSETATIASKTGTTSDANNIAKTDDAVKIKEDPVVPGGKNIDSLNTLLGQMAGVVTCGKGGSV